MWPNNTTCLGHIQSIQLLYLLFPADKFFMNRCNQLGCRDRFPDSFPGIVLDLLYFSELAAFKRKYAGAVYV